MYATSQGSFGEYLVKFFDLFRETVEKIMEDTKKTVLDNSLNFYTIVGSLRTSCVLIFVYERLFFFIGYLGRKKDECGTGRGRIRFGANYKRYLFHRNNTKKTKLPFG